MALSKPPFAFKRTNTDGDDLVKAPKLAKRFNEAMSLASYPDPIRVDPRCIAVSKCNRLFSVQQLHCVIFKSIFKDGHDPLRPAPGILCEVRDPAYMKELLDDNEKLCATPLMPTLYRDLVRYESLGANHYNVVLRIGRECGYTPAGDLSKLKEVDASWVKACTEGHIWIVPPRPWTSP